MSDNVQRLADLCEAIIRPMAGYPEELHVSARRESPSRTIRVAINCSHYDFPRLMGRDGRNHNAIKMIVSIAAASLGEAATIYVDPPLSKFQVPKVEFEAKPDAPLEPILKSVEAICKLVFHGRPQIAHRSEHHTSWIDIKVDPEEKLMPPVIESLAKELRTITHAQGKSIGRVVYIYVTK